MCLKIRCNRCKVFGWDDLSREKGHEKKTTADLRDKIENR